MIAALNRMVEPLKKERLKLVIWDCYRPLEVQKAMWKLVPDPRYVADPKVGSNHNRGAAIDLALMSEDGVPLRFPTGFDDFSKKAHVDYACSQEEKELCENRDKLKKMMLEVGLQVFPTEWWHFQLPSAEQLPLIKSFEATK